METFLGNNVNTIVDIKDLSDEFLELLTNKSKSYLYEYQFKKDKVKKIGLQIYKDYFTCLAVIYPNDNNKGTWIDIGHFGNIGYDTCYLDLGSYNIETITKEVRALLKDNYKVIENLEEDELYDALASGDYDAVGEIVGDRDLAEFI